MKLKTLVEFAIFAVVIVGLVSAIRWYQVKLDNAVATGEFVEIKDDH